MKTRCFYYPILLLALCTLGMPSASAVSCLGRIQSLLAKSTAPFGGLKKRWNQFLLPKEWKHFRMDQFNRALSELREGKIPELSDLETRLAYLEYLGEQNPQLSRLRGMHGQVSRMKRRKKKQLIRILKRFNQQKVERPEVIHRLIAELYTIQYSPTLSIYSALMGKHDQRMGQMIYQMAEKKILQEGILKLFSVSEDQVPAGVKEKLLKAYRDMAYTKLYPIIKVYLLFPYRVPFPESTIVLKKIARFPYRIPALNHLTVTREQALNILTDGIDSEPFIRDQMSRLVYSKYRIDLYRPLTLALLGYGYYEVGKVTVGKGREQIQEMQNFFDGLDQSILELEQKYQELQERQAVTDREQASLLVEKGLDLFEQMQGRPPNECEYLTIASHTYQEFGLEEQITHDFPDLKNVACP